jgi:tripartite-type tricarboxylate transporter receptor subunit TctC
MDVLARAAVGHIAKELGVPIVIENRVGSGGMVATNAVMQAAPDGYTLLIGAIATVLRPLMDQTANYDPLTALTPIVLLGDTPNVILAGRGNTGLSLRDLVDRAKQKSEGLTIGHPGPGTMGHLATEFLASYAGLKATFVSYRNGPQMLPDLLEGRLDAGIAAYTPALKSGQILAVMTPRPVKFLPGVPTTAEAGFPGLEATTWFALFGPAGLPADIVAKLNKAANTYLTSTDAEAKLPLIGLQALGGTPGDLEARMRQDMSHWAGIISQQKIKISDPQ